ncbi:Retrovirus-related Pol polyprotein from transposon 17.6 [Mytilus coruscus]|uniref:Retrovirus-related Pol polyprotein from transposon 17.6 n=1 Tax=Mytilus coruscus TaxID=42192 RepID=A0A6J8DAT1_MYTCO|nr:Retrovirus-related Pol polyprotein from transposon 17.6 [Mytilus coruscus]
MDLSSGYWQVEMDEKDKEKTAFTSNKGLFHFNVMPMGLCNGVAIFQRLMEYTLAGLNWQTCLKHMDDIVFLDSFESHLTRLGDRIAAQGLKVAPKKCSFFQNKVSFLGHIVSPEGMAADPGKIESVKMWPIPKTITDVRSFLSTCSYYRKCIQNTALI